FVSLFGSRLCGHFPVRVSGIVPQLAAFAGGGGAAAMADHGFQPPVLSLEEIGSLFGSRCNVRYRICSRRPDGRALRRIGTAPDFAPSHGSTPQPVPGHDPPAVSD